MSNRATASLPHVVIVGAGFGGLQAAMALKKAPVRVTIIDRKNHHLFQPLLYQVATAELSPADIATPIRAIMRHHKNTEVVMAEVTGIDMEGRRVLMGERSLHYDYLVLATGSWHSYFGHNQWEQYAPGLKSITDATAIRRKILLAFEAAELEPDPEKQRALLTFVIVGGGPTGVEMAGAIAELARKSIVKDFRHINAASARIILVEAAPHILATFPASLTRKAQKQLERMGVEVITGTPVTDVDADGVQVNGERIATKTVIWAAGVAASPAGKWLNAETDKAGRVMVLSDLTLPHHPEIFVIGDSSHIMTSEKPLPGVAPVAMQQGRYVAEVIRRRLKGDFSVRPFHYVDKGNLATVGRSFAIADIKHLHLSGFIAWVTWLVVHIFYLIGFRNRVLVMIQWAWAYFTYQRGARLITGEQEETRRIPQMQSLAKR